MQSSDIQSVFASRFHLIAVAVIVLAVLIFAARLLPGPLPSNDVLAATWEVNAERAFADGDLRTAGRLAGNVLRKQPHNVRARLLAAKCLRTENRFADALELLLDTPGQTSPHFVEARCLAGDMLFHNLCRPTEAERIYREAADVANPTAVEASDRLAILLSITGNWWDQIPVRIASIRGGRFSRLDLIVLALADKALLNPEFAEVMQQRSSDDPLALLAGAGVAIEEQRHDDAIALLQRSIQLDQNLSQAQVLLGSIYLQSSEDARFVNWIDQLPSPAHDHPGIWVLRGRWAQQTGQESAALRCYCEAVARDPNCTDALYRAGTQLESMNRSDVAGPLLTRAADLQRLINATKAVGEEDSLAHVERAAALAESLGNMWEAWAWVTLAASHGSGQPDYRKTLSRLRAELETFPDQRTAPGRNPILAFGYKSLPLPQVFDGTSAVENNAELAVGPTSRVSFRERTDIGLAFNYENGTDNGSADRRSMYEVMGGGIGVLDIDGDDQPDLYYSQGGSWPKRDSDTNSVDRLYLNRHPSGFVDVTEACGIFEYGFSQGVAVGDVDSDGFADILVGNIGRNRLYCSNGDGTFHDASDAVPFDSTDWSTSCAIADVSGDGLADLYVVNYLTGEDVFSRVCGPRQRDLCLPQHFAAAADRLYLNEGQGRFSDISSASGIDTPGGKGLGIVVGAFDESRRLNVFVANDTVLNFYFDNQGDEQGPVPFFREQALVTGLALGGDGSAQACMGVAAGDADGDGRIDLFVTNFHGESNTLYRQQQAGVFEDVSIPFHLQAPSLTKLGFGTQFLDADLDGRLDLIVVNGHIDDYSADGRTEYHMRPQFFANNSSAGFREIASASLGSYFIRRMLGRALARLDWNSDGLEDFTVTHLDAPVALLENTTAAAGNWIVFTLHGSASSRDAIGARVRIRTDRLELTRHLTAGDGFQASNQRMLTFGVGSDEIVRDVTIEWPSGQTDRFTDLPANTHWIAVEGRRRLFDAPPQSVTSVSR